MSTAIDSGLRFTEGSLIVPYVQPLAASITLELAKGVNPVIQIVYYVMISKNPALRREDN